MVELNRHDGCQIQGERTTDSLLTDNANRERHLAGEIRSAASYYYWPIRALVATRYGQAPSWENHVVGDVCARGQVRSGVSLKKTNTNSLYIASWKIVGFDWYLAGCRWHCHRNPCHMLVGWPHHASRHLTAAWQVGPELAEAKMLRVQKPRQKTATTIVMKFCREYQNIVSNIMRKFRGSQVSFHFIKPWIVSRMGLFHARHGRQKKNPEEKSVLKWST
jgi:hypothetical protein